MKAVQKYHRRRWKALQRICGEPVPMCEWCGRLYKVDIDRLDIHHPNPEDRHGSGIGGKQHLLKVEEDLENEVELEVLCPPCHEAAHDDQPVWGHVFEVET
ncbi:MAG: hypothetical protein ABEJ98_05145 [Candidatus Nanohaloarchaea archaeon]